MWSKNSGRDWQIVVFGDRPKTALDHRIDARGFAPLEQVRRELADSDLLLLPLPVGSDSLQMTTSVPTKLSTYLEVGRLVFALLPANSTTASVWPR